MNEVWKYRIDASSRITLLMPAAARVLTVQMQGGIPVLWVQVDPSRPRMHRHFRVLSTGEGFDARSLTYVGTWQDDGYVRHLYEEQPVREPRTYKVGEEIVRGDGTVVAY